MIIAGRHHQEKIEQLFAARRGADGSISRLEWSGDERLPAVLQAQLDEIADIERQIALHKPSYCFPITAPR